MTYQFNNLRTRELSRSAFFTIFILLFSTAIFAQDGNAGLTQANTMIRGYYENAVQIMYAVGGLLAIIGAIHVYSLWGHNARDAQKAAVAWFGSSIFLVTVSTVIKSFYGL